MLRGFVWHGLGRYLSISPLSQLSNRQISSNCGSLLIKFSPLLFAEPLKKKKRLDPAVIKAREDRRKKKLEKQIRRLEKNARQLKPIDEVDPPLTLADEKSLRIRPTPDFSREQLEERALLMKEWTRYKCKQYLSDLHLIDRFVCSQQKALDELRAESEELYQEAVQIDPGLIPMKVKGPVRTPPINNYESPDGEYIDVTKKWD